MLLVDLPGHGQSVDMDGPYGLVEFADSLCAAQDKAGITASHFWGTHLGAGAGLILAAQYPHRVHSLIVEAPVLPGYPLPSVTGILDKVRHTAIHSGVDAARHIWLAESPWFAVMRESARGRAGIFEKLPVRTWPAHFAKADNPIQKFI